MRSGRVHRIGPWSVAVFFVLALLARDVLAADSSKVGAWSPVEPWPLIAIHSVLMPDGRVLTYGSTPDGHQSGIFGVDVWDPAAGPDAGHLALPNTTGTDIFCSSQVVLASGSQVFIAGGDNWTGSATTNTANNNSNLFDYGNDTLTRQSDMNRARWYSSSMTLLDGRVYIQGGTSGEDHPEVRQANGSFQLLTGADTSGLFYFFPRNFVAPDGRVFGIDANAKMYYVNTAGNGSLTQNWQFTGSKGRDANTAMYRPGRILQYGGNTKTAKIIDLTSGAPVVTSTSSLSSNRRWGVATVLPDGKVLATGGSDVANEMTGVAYAAEIWDPTTGKWTLGAAEARARLYHSTALLLPDASVLVAGGGADGPQTNLNAEIYYPPYLFSASGNPASRPVIDAAPSFIEIGGSFTLDLAGTTGASRVTLVKTGSVSHGFNMDQRFVELTFQQSGGRLTVQGPARSADAPPGFYMIFVLNAAGTPSIGRIARIGVAGEHAPSAAPNLANPGNQTAVVGTSVLLPLTATDADSPALEFGASGLPPGVSINSSTGVISGVPTTIGSYDVTVTASDGTNGDSASFVWTVSQAPSSFTLYPPPPVGPASVGASITLEAGVSGGEGLLFKWDFDDGTPPTDYGPSPAISHEFAEPGIYYVTVTAVDAGGIEQVATVVVTVHRAPTAHRPAASSDLAFEDRGGSGDRVWVVNQDNDSVSVINASTNARIAEIPVGSAPRSLAIVPGGDVWVSNKRGASISVVDRTSLAVSRTIALPFASQPFGVAADPSGTAVYVVLEGSGRLLKMEPGSGSVLASLDVGPNPRQVSVTGDGSSVYVSRFITPPLPGESTATVQTPAGTGGEVLVVDASSMTVRDSIRLRHSDKADSESQGRGIPNFLGAAAISPDGRTAWVPSKQDNVKRGTRRDATGLTFQNTVRAISSRIDLAGGAEDYAARIDHDNAGVASAVAYDRYGNYAFVALPTSREVAVVDAYGAWEIFRFDAGRTPDGVATSADGRRLYVSNFMDRTVGVYDLAKLLDEGIADVPLVATVPAIGTEKLAAQVLLGKRLFYDAKDVRLARDGYLSCGSCHDDGGYDGRTWDLTGFGEGLRNTSSLRGRAGGQGFLHWSGNFDEVQDFEGQIRALSGGTGLMTNAQFNQGTRSQPLGDKKAGVSADLDALAAYVGSLNAFDASPMRNADGTLTAAAVAGKSVFEARGCASCHAGTAFTVSGAANLKDIGTINADSGKRLGATLAGIDVPTLRDAWATAPYLHRGSAATLGDAIRAHAGVTITDADLSTLVAYVSQIGGQETSAPGTPPPPSTPNSGAGLAGAYFNNKTLTGSPVMQRVEAVNFSWSTNSPGSGIVNDAFSVRWTGKVEAISTGNYTFQTTSNDGVRLWINGILVVDNWASHATATNNSPVIAMTKNQRYTIAMEYYDNTGAAVAKLKWKKPGATSFAAVPASRLYAN